MVSKDGALCTMCGQIVKPITLYEFYEIVRKYNPMKVFYNLEVYGRKKRYSRSED